MTRLEEMKALAMEEAYMLKQHATKEEIGSLRIDRFDPDNYEECIYGQITGNCYSVRALELIKECCTKVYEPKDRTENLLTNSVLNGKPYDIEAHSRKYKYHSPIECLIINDEVGGACAEKLIAFLKDETKELSL